MFDQRVEELVRDQVKIGTVPATLARAQKVFDDPESTLVQLAQVIERDPPIATEALRIANSPLNGLRVQATTLSAACIALGFNALKQLVVQATLLDRFREGPDIGIDLEELWDHSLRTALAARLLAIGCSDTYGFSVDEAYTCGFLRDIGLVAILQGQPGELERALEMSRRDSVPISEALRQVIGFDHGHVLAHIAETWRLGDRLRYSALGPDEWSSDDERWIWSALVSAAANIARSLARAPVPWLPDPVESDALEALGVDEDLAEGVREVVAEATARQGCGSA